MSSRVVYVAEPIDFAKGAILSVGAALALEISRNAWAVYRPASSWYVPSGFQFPAVNEVNRDALGRAEALVAYLPNGTPSIGVPREIELAIQLGIPVAVLIQEHDVVGQSLSDVFVTSSIHEIVSWLEQVEIVERREPLRFHVEPGGRPPSVGHAGDAGFDLYCSEETKVEPGQFVDIPTGVRVALPEDMWLRICGRSSTLRKRGLLCAEGIIDTGYRGLLYGGVWNLTSEVVTVAAGERIIQAVPHWNLAPDLLPTMVSQAEFDAIPAGDQRGAKGFGSTGD